MPQPVPPEAQEAAGRRWGHSMRRGLAGVRRGRPRLGEGVGRLVVVRRVGPGGVVGRGVARGRVVVWAVVAPSWAEVGTAPAGTVAAGVPALLGGQGRQ